MRQFAAWVEPQLAKFGDLGHMTDWGGKLVGAVARIAALLHMAGNSGAVAPWHDAVPLDTVERAIQIGMYLIPHARAAYGSMGADPDVADALHILAWVKRTATPSFTKREAFEALKGRFKRAVDMDPALNRLVEHEYIRLQPQDNQVGPGRKPSPRYDVNPAVFASHNAHNAHNSSMGMEEAEQTWNDEAVEMPANSVTPSAAGQVYCHPAQLPATAPATGIGRRFDDQPSDVEQRTPKAGTASRPDLDTESEWPTSMTSSADTDAVPGMSATASSQSILEGAVPTAVHQPNDVGLSFTRVDIELVITKEKIAFVRDQLPRRGATWARAYMNKVAGFAKWPAYLRRAVEDLEAAGEQCDDSLDDDATMLPPADPVP